MTERMDVSGPDPNRPHGPGSGGPLRNLRAAWQTPGGKPLALISAVAALAVGGVVGAAAGGSTKTTTVTQPGPTVVVTQSATPPSSGASSTAAGGSGSGSGSGSSDTGPSAPSGTTPASQSSGLPSTDPTQIGTVPLVDLAAASGKWGSRNANPMINGKLQQFSILQDLPQTNANGDVGYNLGRDYTKFTGVIGLDDNSPKSNLHPTVEIDGDGLKLATYTPTLGHPAQISLNVSGVLRLDIKYISLDGDGWGDTAGTLILGDGQLTTVPGYHPPAPSPSS